MLRVLAGVYTPQQGQVEISGSISTLFTLYLGADITATGYDNIILRGLVLGLSKSQIKQKVEDIAEFRELGSFLRMPVRT